MLGEGEHGFVKKVDAKAEGAKGAKRQPPTEGRERDFVVKRLVEDEGPGDSVGKGEAVSVKRRGSVDESCDGRNRREDEGEQGEPDSARKAQAALGEGKKGSAAENRQEAQEDGHRNVLQAQVPQARQGGTQDRNGQYRPPSVERPKKGQYQR